MSLLAKLYQEGCLGRGSGGIVWKMMHQVIGELFALKELLDAFEEDKKKKIKREISILQTVMHPNLGYYGTYQSDWKIRILLEFMDSGSLEGRHITDEGQIAYVAK